MQTSFIAHLGESRLALQQMNLADLGRRRFVSQSALSELLKELKSVDELPNAISRQSVKRARDDRMSIDTPVGPLFVKKQLASIEGPGQH